MAAAETPGALRGTVFKVRAIKGRFVEHNKERRRGTERMRRKMRCFPDAVPPLGFLPVQEGSRLDSRAKPRRPFKSRRIRSGHQGKAAEPRGNVNIKAACVCSDLKALKGRFISERKDLVCVLRASSQNLHNHVCRIGLTLATREGESRLFPVTQVYMSQ